MLRCVCRSGVALAVMLALARGAVEAASPLAAIYGDVESECFSAEPPGYGTALIGTLVRPGCAFTRVARSNRSAGYGWLTTVGYSTLYSLTALQLAAKDWEIRAPAVLPIPEDRYYWYQTGFTVPVGVAGVGANALTCYGLSRAWGSDVTLFELWGPVSLAAAVPTLVTMWIPETFVLPMFAQDSLWPQEVDLGRIAAGAAWSVCLNVVAVRAATRLNWWQSACIGVAGGAVMGTIMGVCYR